MAFCCDLTCTVVSVHIQANRELQLVELDDPMEYLSNLNRVHLSMILPTQALQITQMDCIKIWSECTFKNILKVNFLKSLILKSNVQITRKYNLHHRTLSPRDKFHLRYLEEVATDEEDGEEEEENENEKELELEENDDGDKEEEKSIKSQRNPNIVITIATASRLVAVAGVTTVISEMSSAAENRLR